MKSRLCLIFLIVIVLQISTHADEIKIFNLLESRWDERNEFGYKLYLMEDEAIPFLVSNFSNRDRQTRENAMHCIQRYYPIPEVMSVLTVVFLHNEDSWMRNKAAHIMADIDAEFTKKFLVKHIDSDPDTQKTVVDVLLKLKDEHVIPYLAEIMEKSKTLPERRKYALYGLADLKDNRAVPELLKILKSPNTNTFDVLRDSIYRISQIDDPRTVSILIEAMDPNSPLGRRTSTTISQYVLSRMSQYDTSSLQKMLDTVKHTESKEVENNIYKVLRVVQNKELIPIFEKECLETDNESLRSVLVNALSNMGEAGYVALLNIAEQKPSQSVLTTLTTFNKPEAIEIVGRIALDSSSQLQMHAVEAIVKFGLLWKTEISKYLPQLLEDTNPDVRMIAISHIRELRLSDMIPQLKELADKSRGNTRNAAFMVIDELLGKAPLDLKIEMVSTKYEYGHPIALKYSIKNVSNYNVKIGFNSGVDSGYLMLKIKKPDGTDAQMYRQDSMNRRLSTNRYSLISAKHDEDEVILLPIDPKNFSILKPNDVLTGMIPVSKNFRLFQTGQYTVKLKVFLSPWKPVPAPIRTDLNRSPPLGSQMKSKLIPWEKTLISPAANFEIKEPTQKQLNTLIRKLDPHHVNNYEINHLEHVCFQLGELRKPEAIESLILLNTSLINVRSSSRSKLSVAAHRALLNYTETDRYLLWRQVMDKQNMYNEVISDVIYKLRTSGNAKDLKPLRQIFMQSRNNGVSVEIAIVLSHLGDDSCLEWLRLDAHKRIESSNQQERMSAAVLLSQLMQSQAKDIRLPKSLHDDSSVGELHENFHISKPIWYTNDLEHFSLRNPWFYARHYDPTIRVAEMQKQAETIEGLKKLLGYKNQHVQRAAAYDLASYGDRTGIKLIERDLGSADSETRLHARSMLARLIAE